MGARFSLRQFKFVAPENEIVCFLSRMKFNHSREQHLCGATYAFVIVTLKTKKKKKWIAFKALGNSAYVCLSVLATTLITEMRLIYVICMCAAIETPLKWGELGECV